MFKIKQLLIVAGIISASQSYAQQIGDLDTSFNNTGKVITDFAAATDGADGIAIQTDGKLVVVGYSVVGNNERFALARYNVNGSIDSTFGGTGTVITDFASGYDFASCVAIQPDGKIIAAGQKSTNFVGNNAMIRYLTDGTIDSTFGVNGKVETALGIGDAGITAIALQPDGKIVVTEIATTIGSGQDFAVTRYNADGSIDTGFGTNNGTTFIDFTNTHDFAFSLALQSDGKIVAGGASGPDPQYDFALVRLDSTGTPDNSFGLNGRVFTDLGNVEDWGYGLKIQTDGKIVMAGYSGSGNVSKVGMARYNTDGTLDTTFNGTGKVITQVTSHDEATSLALQTDGKIVVAGQGYGANNDFIILRYDSTGAIDNTFSGNGFTTTDFGSATDKARAMTIQPDGKIVAVGNGGNDFAVARYIVSLTTGLIDFATMNNQLLIYPNPVQQNAVLSYTLTKDEEISIKLIDMNGNLVNTIVDQVMQNASEHKQEISLPESLSAGVYFIVISNQTNQMSIKIVKQ